MADNTTAACDGNGGDTAPNHLAKLMAPERCRALDLWGHFVTDLAKSYEGRLCRN
jgi:hypothetical protein